MKLVYKLQYMAIFFTFSPTSNHLHPLQIENCDSNSRLVVDEDDNDKLRLERLNRRRRLYPSLDLHINIVFVWYVVLIRFISRLNHCYWEWN